MRQVRALSPELGGQIPAAALTAYAGHGEYTQALAAGFQTHIAKPTIGFSRFLGWESEELESGEMGEMGENN